MKPSRLETTPRGALRGLLAFALATTTLSVEATAQCPLPDGLDGGLCCSVAQPNVPAVPRFKQGALGICWRDCDVEQTNDYTAIWTKFLSSPPGSSCRPSVKRFRLRDSTGALAWSGALTLQYSRTWQEFDAAGTNLQVWRYLVNGDLSPTAAAGLTPCPVPPCAAQNNNRVRFTGYLDMARDCAPGSVATEYAWMLQHGCDVLDHSSGFPRGGFFHPNRTYTFVGPSAGFAVGPIQPVESGGTALEAVRRVRTGTGLGPQCEFEEQIDCGLSLQQELCICGFPTAPLQYAISDLGLGGSCGTSIVTPGGPLLPGFVSMGIGTWTDPTAYPGLEILRWNTGNYDYFDPCTTVTRNEVFFGVTTIGGYAAATVNSAGVGFPLPDTFVDQCNSLKGGSTIMNVPYRSDHFLNLNF